MTTREQSLLIRSHRAMASAGCMYAAAGVDREAARALGLPEPEEYSRSAERPNLRICIGDPAREHPRLMLAGHLDTVPPGNLSLWQTDP